jgi:hypothetical protein
MRFMVRSRGRDLNWWGVSVTVDIQDNSLGNNSGAPFRNNGPVPPIRQECDHTETAHVTLTAVPDWLATATVTCKRCATLGIHDLPVDDEAHLLFSCPATAVVRRECRFAQLPFTSLQDLMCCRDVYGGHCLCTNAWRLRMQQLQLLPGHNLDEVES